MADPWIPGWRSGRGAGRWLNIGLPYAWLVVFFLLPFLIVLRISLSEAVLAQPPYSDLIHWTDGAVLDIRLNLANLRLLWDDPLYAEALLNSLVVAANSTLACLLLGYPMAYAIATAPGRWRMPLLMLIILPFWTSFLIRIYAWMGLLKSNGLLNDLLLALGIVDQPVPILHTPLAVYIGIVYGYLPFMILPLYANLVRMDRSLVEAAMDLGCRPSQAFVHITLPLSRAGIVAGCMLVFIPVVGEFVIPDLLGGPRTLMVGKVLWTEFFSNRDWPVASALAIVLLCLLVIPFVVLQRWLQRSQG